jgi:hypothetical protein
MIAVSLDGSPAPMNVESFTRQLIQSESLLLNFTDSSAVFCQRVSARSIFTDHPGLSSVSIQIPLECSHKPLHCARYQADKRSSKSSDTLSSIKHKEGGVHRNFASDAACHFPAGRPAPFAQVTDCRERTGKGYGCAQYLLSNHRSSLALERG